MLKDYIKENRTVRGFDQSEKVSTEELTDMTVPAWPPPA